MPDPFGCSLDHFIGQSLASADFQSSFAHRKAAESWVSHHTVDIVDVFMQFTSDLIKVWSVNIRPHSHNFLKAMHPDF